MKGCECVRWNKDTEHKLNWVNLRELTSHKNQNEENLVHATHTSLSFSFSDLNAGFMSL